THHHTSSPIMPGNNTAANRMRRLGFCMAWTSIGYHARASIQRRSTTNLWNLRNLRIPSLLMHRNHPQAHRRRDGDALPRRLQFAGRFVDAEDDHRIRILIAHQQELARRVDGEVARLLDLVALDAD